jgi:ribosome-binding factor A
MTERRRTHRVAETIRKHVAEALSRELFDPRLGGLMLTRVEISPDLSSARIYFRSLAGAPDAAAQTLIAAAANRAAPALRRGLGERLATKRTPELTFYYDQGQDAVDRVEQLLGEIARESSGRTSE